MMRTILGTNGARLLPALLCSALLLTGCSSGDKKKEEEKKNDKDISIKINDKDGGIKIGDKDGGIKIGDKDVTIKIGDKPTETKGPKGTPGPFEQTGNFRTPPSSSGDVYFPIPYDKAPEVTIRKKVGLHKVEITDVTKGGFKWKNDGKDSFFDNNDMEYTAKGVPVEGLDKTPFEQKGEFKVEPGKTGEVKFESAYTSPPHVEIAAKLGLHKVAVTEVTATGFKWKNTGTDNFFDTKDMTYTARGVKAK